MHKLISLSFKDGPRWIVDGCEIPDRPIGGLHVNGIRILGRARSDCFGWLLVMKWFDEW